MIGFMQKNNYNIWHPYTAMKTADPPILISSTKGSEIYDEEGNCYIDAISSWWVNLHGHCNETISKSVQEQLETLEHVIFAGFTHKPAIELCENLLSILPKNQSRIFFSDNGSTAVEVALKIAIQYRANRGEPQKNIISLEGSYHGDTFGSMSVSSRSIFTKPFEEHLFHTTFIPVPSKKNKEYLFNKFKKIIGSSQTAAFIFEPIVQGVAGMNMYEAEHLDTLISICKENRVITIADEVMTGFGRLGKNFASDFLSQSPDIICLSKGLTGGFMPLGVTSVTEEIYQTFFSDDFHKTFFHGHSYTGNPLSCAAANASIQLLQKAETKKKIDMISKSHLQFADALKNISIIKGYKA